MREQVRYLFQRSRQLGDRLARPARFMGRVVRMLGRLLRGTITLITVFVIVSWAVQANPELLQKLPELQGLMDLAAPGVNWLAGLLADVLEWLISHQ